MKRPKPLGNSWGERNIEFIVLGAFLSVVFSCMVGGQWWSSRKEAIVQVQEYEIKRRQKVTSKSASDFTAQQGFVQEVHTYTDNHCDVLQLRVKVNQNVRTWQAYAPHASEERPKIRALSDTLQPHAELYLWQIQQTDSIMDENARQKAIADIENTVPLVQGTGKLHDHILQLETLSVSEPDGFSHHNFKYGRFVERPVRFK
ncbi:MAG: hypothetical protein QF486_00665 [Candidatus Woesearchaeota archaeon]|jgi:hypothetical protein|nr:hypothetical protein [Candidatus Woesearchaeota archaeon]MDP7181268.1 hypothetical protein [Candidatus Woesearchaeota archaeon]MDP7198113.1 hypothetical protein [Candidatus Woesearchaeota archaeon]MDP7466947.1 hypothetical protein [Candidatus Woesearchaeota archaeon]MDP7646968.1 hypothetical protein [Candidatus Woesearchaeota archaeon]